MQPNKAAAGEALTRDQLFFLSSSTTSKSAFDHIITGPAEDCLDRSSCRARQPLRRELRVIKSLYPQLEKTTEELRQKLETGVYLLVD
jgi:hypothetical protein